MEYTKEQRENAKDHLAQAIDNLRMAREVAIDQEETGSGNIWEAENEIESKIQELAKLFGITERIEV